MVRIRK